MIDVKVINSNINKRDNISTEATTWGELRIELEEQGLASGDYQGVVKESSATLNLDGADLPTEDFTLFVVVKKSKAGAEDYSTWSYNQLRAECASRDSVLADSPGNYGSSEAMIRKLKEDDASNSETCNVSEDLVSRLEVVADRLEHLLSTEEKVEEAEEVEDNSLTQEEREYAEMLENNL